MKISNGVTVKMVTCFIIVGFCNLFYTCMRLLWKEDGDAK